MVEAREVVYGVSEVQNQAVFIPKEQAVELASVWAAVDQAATWGDLRKRLSARRYAEAIAQISEDGSEPPETQPFDRDGLGALTDGDWPDFPAQIATEWMPSAVLALGESANNMVSGDWVEFRLEAELDAVAALRQHGFSVERDDALVAVACGWE